MKFFKIASSRTGSTEIAQGEDGSFVQIEYRKSGAVDYTPIESIPDWLTVRYASPEFMWEMEKPQRAFTTPVVR